MTTNSTISGASKAAIAVAACGQRRDVRYASVAPAANMMATAAVSRTWKARPNINPVTSGHTSPGCSRQLSSAVSPARQKPSSTASTVGSSNWIEKAGTVRNNSAATKPAGRPARRFPILAIRIRQAMLKASGANPIVSRLSPINAVTAASGAITGQRPCQ